MPLRRYGSRRRAGGYPYRRSRFVRRRLFRYGRARSARPRRGRIFRYPTKNLRITGTLGVEKHWSTYYFPARTSGGGYLTYGLLLSNLDQGLDLTAQIYRCDPGNEETPSATKGNLFIIPVGDGPTDRTGNRVVIKMLYIHGTITWPLVAQATADPYSKLNDTRVHILVVADSQTNGAGCTLDDIFDNCASQTGGTAYESFQFGNMLQRNLVKSTRFKILFHKTYSKHNTQTTGGFSSTYPAGSPPANGNVGQMPCSQTFKLSKKLTLPVTYNYGTTGAITEIMDNSLHLFAWHSGGDTGYQATGCSPYLSYSVRTRFFG